FSSRLLPGGPSPWSVSAHGSPDVSSLSLLASWTAVSSKGLVLTKSDSVLRGGASGFAAGVCAADATGRLRTAAAPKAPAMAAPHQGLSPMTLLLDASCALV